MACTHKATVGPPGSGNCFLLKHHERGTELYPLLRRKAVVSLVSYVNLLFYFDGCAGQLIETAAHAALGLSILVPSDAQVARRPRPRSLFSSPQLPFLFSPLSRCRAPLFDLTNIFVLLSESL